MENLLVSNLHLILIGAILLIIIIFIVIQAVSNDVLLFGNVHYFIVVLVDESIFYLLLNYLLDLVIDVMANKTMLLIVKLSQNLIFLH